MIQRILKDMLVKISEFSDADPEFVEKFRILTELNNILSEKSEKEELSEKELAKVKEVCSDVIKSLDSVTAESLMPYVKAVKDPLTCYMNNLNKGTMSLLQAGSDTSWLDDYIGNPEAVKEDTVYNPESFKSEGMSYAELIDIYKAEVAIAKFGFDKHVARLSKDSNQPHETFDAKMQVITSLILSHKETDGFPNFSEAARDGYKKAGIPLDLGKVTTLKSAMGQVLCKGYYNTITNNIYDFTIASGDIEKMKTVDEATRKRLLDIAGKVRLKAENLGITQKDLDMMDKTGLPLATLETYYEGILELEAEDAMNGLKNDAIIPVKTELKKQVDKMLSSIRDDNANLPTADDLKPLIREIKKYINEQNVIDDNYKYRVEMSYFNSAVSEIAIQYPEYQDASQEITNAIRARGRQIYDWLVDEIPKNPQPADYDNLNSAIRALYMKGVVPRDYHEKMRFYRMAVNPEFLESEVSRARDALAEMVNNGTASNSNDFYDSIKSFDNQTFTVDDKTVYKEVYKTLLFGEIIKSQASNPIKSREDFENRFGDFDEVSPVKHIYNMKPKDFQELCNDSEKFKATIESSTKGYFDDAILLSAYRGKVKEFKEEKEGIYTDFFKAENLNKAYDYEKLKEFFKDKTTSSEIPKEERDKYSSYSKMEIFIRRRLIYFLLLAEIDANPNLTMGQLMDNTSPEGIQRKRAAADKVKEWFNSEITPTKDFAKLVVDNGKKFKAMFNSVAGTDFSDEKAAMEKMDELGSLAYVYFDAINQLGSSRGIGISDKDMIDDAKVIFLLQNTHARNGVLYQLDTKNISLSRGMDRRATLGRMCAMAIPHKAATVLKDKEQLDALSTSGEVTALTSSTILIVEEMYNKKSGIYGKLTDDELTKLAFVPSLSEKLTIDYTINGDENDVIKVTFDGVTIYDNKDTTVLADDDENVIAIKNLIVEEYNRYRNVQMGSDIGADCFGENETVEWLIKDIKAAGEQLVTDLGRNTKLGQSSSYYRAMQKAAKGFNKAFRNIDVKKFNDEEGRRQIKEQLKALTATMEGYLAHKDLDNVQYTDPYVLGRINLAKSSLETFNKFHKYCEMADKFHSRQDTWQKNDKAILDKYNAMREDAAKPSNNGNELKETAINGAKMAACEINKLACSKNYLNAEEKKSVVDNFEKMCALCIVSELRNIEDLPEKGVYGSVNDEKLLERIRETRKFKELFADPNKINGDTARKIINDELEYEVRAEFKRGMAKEIIDREAKNKPKVDAAYKVYMDVLNEVALALQTSMFNNYDKEDLLAVYFAEHILVDKLIEKNSMEDKLAPFEERRDKAISMAKEAKEYKNEVLESQAYKGVIEVYRGPQSEDVEGMYQLFLKLDKNPLDAEKIIKEEYERLNPGEKYVPLKDEMQADEELNDSFSKDNAKFDPVDDAKNYFATL